MRYGKLRNSNDLTLIYYGHIMIVKYIQKAVSLKDYGKGKAHIDVSKF